MKKFKIQLSRMATEGVLKMSLKEMEDDDEHNVTMMQEIEEEEDDQVTLTESMRTESMKVSFNDNKEAKKPDTSSSSGSRLTTDVSMSSSGASAYSSEHQHIRAAIQKDVARSKTFEHKLKQYRQDLNKAGRAPHTNGSSYDDLLVQFGELQKDLARTISVSQKMRGDNEDLLRHYDNLKNEHLRLRDKLLECRRYANEETEARLAMEQRQDDLVKRWQKLLETKAKEFDELQSTPPRDPHFVRATLQEEYEAAYKLQFSKLEDEVEKFRTLYAQVHQDHETLKTEFEQFTIDKSKELSSLKSIHSIEVSELHKQIATLHSEFEDSNRQEEIRERSLELEQVRAERDHIAHQLSKALKEVEVTKTELDSKLLSETRQRSEFGTCVKEHNSVVTLMKRKIELANLETRQIQDLLDAANGKNIQQQAEISKLGAKLDAAEKLVDEERARDVKQILEITSKYDRERHELRSTADTLENKLTLSENKHMEQLKLKEVQFASLLKSQEQVNEKTHKKFMDAQSVIESLQKDIGETSNKYELRLRESDDARERLKSQSDKDSGDARRAIKEKDILHDKVKALSDQLRDTRQVSERAENQVIEVEKEYNSLQEAHRELMSSAIQLKSKHERSESKLADMEHELCELEASKVDLKMKNERLMNEHRALNVSVEEKENLLKDQVAETILESSKDSRKLLAKMEKKLSIYHHALEKCKCRIRDLSNKNQKSQQELKSQQRMFRVQENSLSRRIKELEREREIRLQHSFITSDNNDDLLTPDHVN